MTDEQLKRLAKLVAYEIIREIEIKQLDEIFTQNNMIIIKVFALNIY